MDALHRILSGQALSTSQLRWAGYFVLAWFAMDLLQFSDWLFSLFSRLH